jgi:uncharacterized membrane protein
MPLLAQDGSTLGGRVTARLRDALITGAAITIPLLVTLIIVGFAVNFISNALNPVVGVVYQGLGLSNLPRYGVKVAATITLFVGVLLVGLVAQRRPEDGSVENSFDQLMARIPGIGSIYTSFNEMSELLLDSDTDSFQEVKLVEFPDEGSYTVAFLTADTPERVETATGHPDMQTLFLPMAPNPVMGGYVIHVSEERVTDVDMTVQEGIRSIVTSGVAIDDADQPALSADELEALSAEPRVQEVAGTEPPGAADLADPEPREQQARLEQYDDDVDPEHAKKPDGIARRERPEPEDDAATDGAPRTPSDLERLSDDAPPTGEADATETGKGGDDESPGGT